MTIEPRTLQGFRDFLPAAMSVREKLVEVSRRVFRSYGFLPIDTPALEFLDILQGKGGEETDRQIYRFRDHGGREVGLRFDLTVPLARFAAQHQHELYLPFKRYHIATVWRGERPQRGRYREFMQCDFDTVGTEAVAADIEMLLVIYDLMRAIGIEDFQIRVNNRQILNGLLAQLDLSDHASRVLRAVDKLERVGPAGVSAELVGEVGLADAQAGRIMEFIQLEGGGEAVLAKLDPLVADSHLGREGAARLGEILRAIRAVGIPPQSVVIDLAVARGLDYYTSTVVETRLGKLPAIGSVCSGGRYDNLAELYTTTRLPGVGASLGLDRMLAAMDELKLADTRPAAAPVFVPYFDRDRLGDYLGLAARIRAAGYGVEVYPELKKIGQQLKYASERGFRVAVIAGDREFREGTCQIKDLDARTSTNVPLEEDAESIIREISRLVS
jgi:histidyl-tRNA synthetase